jgi:DNA-binding Lrp family transcriptional regulator
MDMDETDVKILKSLIADARLSSRQVAKQCGISIGTALSRTRKLEDEHIIKGYTAVLDHERLGYELTVVTEITVSKGRLLEIEYEIARMPNVCCNNSQIQNARRTEQVHEARSFFAQRRTYEYTRGLDDGQRRFQNSLTAFAVSAFIIVAEGKI